MPRKARTLGDGCVYHVMNRRENEQAVFRHTHDYLAFLEMLLYAKDRYEVELFAFCLMQDHFHLLVRPLKGQNLSHCMQWLQTSYARRFNDYYQAEGPLWQGRYKSFLVEESQCLLTVMSYIEGHPLRSGLVTTAEDYVWSSHRENYWGNQRQKLNELPIPLTSDWSASVDALLNERTLTRLKMSTLRQIPYGSSEWQQQVCREYGLEDSMRPVGRPRKENRAAVALGGLLLGLSLLQPGSLCAEVNNPWTFQKISGSDQAAVLSTAEGSLQLVKVGDTIAPGLRITAISGNRVVLEKKQKTGPVTMRVEIDEGRQKITRIEDKR